MKIAIWILSGILLCVMVFMGYLYYLGSKEVEISPKKNYINPMPNWVYSDSVDEITLEKSKVAMVGASFEFTDGSNKDIILALNNKNGKQSLVLLSQKAPFDILDNENIELKARFDNEDFEKMNFVSGLLKFDGMSSKNADKMIAKLKSCDTLRLECKFLVAGTHVLKFATKGLIWE